MIGIIEKENRYTETFSRLGKNLSGSRLSWLSQIRNQAITRFSELGFPTVRNEEWRFTDVSPISRTVFSISHFPEASGTGTDLKSDALYSISPCRMVFVNGTYSPGLSSFQTLPGQVRIGNLADFLREDSAILQQHISKYANVGDHAFTALNTAFFSDGAFIYLPKETVLDVPVHCIFLSAGGKNKKNRGSEPNLSSPRILVVAERGSKASLIESYAGFEESSYFTNAVTEIWLGENAIVNHCKIQREGRNSFHVGSLYARQERNSTFISHSFSFGGGLVRSDVHAVLSDEGADCTLNGLYAVKGKQQVDHHTVIDHVRPHGTSRELYKGILDGKSKAVFNGKIIVRPDAQKTDAIQSNKNLLLSDEGLIHTKPELNIYANDVKCKHGATIGQIDSDVLYYLRSRGISKEEARRLLVYAFANEIIEGIGIHSVRDELNRLLRTAVIEGGIGT